ncbi:Uu.00g060510.m01.CDS01 [Anthostomella pinea]|uniref:aldehyde dehydrogenase (NAD(+)) n=1 Tax=Anthostomella pinea TaxID=933095 RepID=A0AAI8VS80_9PEZI|nr:Uu.00g060510.m01.CDS01 [Anthostomella pinea]
MWFLSDVTKKNGGTRKYPDSHRGNVTPENIFDIDGSVTAEGPAGTALIFESRLWHATGPNRMDSGERPAILIFFMRQFVRQQENNGLSLRKDVEPKLSDRHKRFMGFYTTGAVGGVDGEVREGVYIFRKDDFGRKIRENTSGSMNMATLKFPELSTYRYSCQDPAKRWAVDNPATGKVITTLPSGDEATVDQAVQASQVAFKERWRPLSPIERAGYLMRCADELEKHVDELATLLCLENGKPAQDAKMFDFTFLVMVFRYFGGLEPFGVCAGILPFNWPPIHTGGKIAPALAAGNTFIVKPGEQAPLTVIRICEILETVLPKDVVQVVPGLGPEVPSALVAHPLVKKVSFTGSTAAGAAVARTASSTVTPLALELGGKNSFTVFDDADFDSAVRNALEGAFFNKGEACTAGSRILVQRGIYDRFVEKLAAGVRKIRMGNGLDPRTHVGPQVSRAQQQRLLDYLALGEKEGARIAAQARLPDDPECRDGFFVPATLFADVGGDMRIVKEEMFGSIVTVTPFDTFEDAVHITNSIEYGLTAIVFTENQLKANRFVRAIEAGMVWVNNYNRNVLGTPFGGVKHSGYGREHCIETLHEWTQPKAVHTLSGQGEPPSWRVVTDIFGASGSDAS